MLSLHPWLQSLAGGQVLELLMDEGLTLRHHRWHSLNNFLVAEKEKQTLRATVVWLSTQSRQSLGRSRPQQEPGPPFWKIQVSTTVPKIGAKKPEGSPVE